MTDDASESRWKYHGVRVVHANELDIDRKSTRLNSSH